MSFENLKLNKAEKILNKVFKNYGGGGLEFEYEYEENGLVARCDLTLKGCDDGILASFKFFTGGNVALDFYFDHLEANAHTLSLLNDFNNNVYYLKAFISDKGYLVVSAPVEYLNLDTLDETMARVMNEFIDDDVQKYLFPLTELTTSD